MDNCGLTFSFGQKSVETQNELIISSKQVLDSLNYTRSSYSVGKQHINHREILGLQKVAAMNTYDCALKFFMISRNSL